MGNNTSTTNPSTTSLPAKQDFLTVPTITMDYKPIPNTQSPNIRIRRSEPNIRAVVKDQTFFTKIGQKRHSILKPGESINFNLLSPNSVNTSSAGSCDLDGLPGASARGSKDLSRIFEENNVSEQISQAVPDEMYDISEESPMKVDSKNKESSIVFDFKEKDILSSLVGEVRSWKIKSDFAVLQDKLRKFHNISIHNVVKLDIIQQDASSRIYRVFHKAKRAFYALKVVEVSNELEVVSAWEEVNSLVKMQELANQNLLQVYDIQMGEVTDEMRMITSFSILMELGTSNLQEYSEFKAKHQLPWEESELITIFWSVLKQAFVLHELGIFHRDIKPSHIIINQSLDGLKLAGFNFIYFYHPKTKQERIFHEELDIVGTEFFFSPELQKMIAHRQTRGRYDPALSDVYAVALSVLKIYNPKLKREDIGQVMAQLQEKFPKLYFYLAGLLEENPEHRKTAFSLIAKDIYDKHGSFAVKESNQFMDYVHKRLIKGLDQENSLLYISTLRSLFLLKEAEAIARHRIKQEEVVNPTSDLMVKLKTMRASLLQDSGFYNKALQELNSLSDLHSKMNGKTTLNISKVFDNMGKAYRSLGNYTEAMEFAKKALETKEKMNDDQAEIANSYQNIGQIYLGQGKLQEAEESFEKAYFMKRSIFGDSHIETAGSLESLASVYGSNGNFAKAIELYRTALAIRTSAYGDSHPSIGQIYHNIGGVYESQGKYKDAFKEYEKALEIKKKFFGEEHLDTATTIGKIGTIYKHFGKYGEAMKMYFKSLNIKKHFLDENHPEIASSYHSIGTLYFVQKKYAEALGRFNDAFNINFRYYGEDHPNVALSLLDVASVYQAQHNYPLAIANYKKALNILIKYKREKHSDTALIYNNLGATYEKLGKYDEALEKYQQALEIKLALYGSNHPSTAATYNNMGLLYEKQGKFQEALDKLNEALEIKIKNFGEKHPSVASTYSNLGLAYCKQGRSDLGIENYEKALKIKINSLGKNDTSVADTYFYIGNAQKSRGRKLEAKETLQNALEIYYKNCDDKNPKVEKIHKMLRGLDE